ncbi:MAG: SCO family protein [Bacteroidetes bacterium]|nr:SCO family protein [Bacteroidota bacterium]MBS1757660.1 SCO family protein [Bacteroidota bacterium]
MKKKGLIYLVFFVLLLAGFYAFVFKDYDFSASNLPVINANVPDFSFVNQDGKKITKQTTEGKVYVTEYFFTTCKGICPRLNANMRRVFDAYKNDENFLIISHTCMPEVDSVPVLKAYEQKMINGKLLKGDDGSYTISYLYPAGEEVANTNWNFVTGDKASLYKLAREGYMIDNGKPDSTQLIKDQFIHTQFFALVDKSGRVRGIYDGLKEDEVQKLLVDIKSLLKEKIDHKRFMGGFSNNPG